MSWGSGVMLKDTALSGVRTHTLTPPAGCFRDQTVHLHNCRAAGTHRATLLPPADIQLETLLRMKQMAGGVMKDLTGKRHHHDEHSPYHLTHFKAMHDPIVHC